MSYIEHHKRSIAKALAFQIIIILTDIVIIFLITHRTGVTISIILLTNLVSAVIYFIHERAWNRIHWGKSKIEIELK
jgi:adenylylsulfate kinase